MFNKWSLTIGRGPFEFKARVLPQEIVFAGMKPDGSEPMLKYDHKVGDWAREARSYPVTDPKSMSSWVLVFPENEASKAKDFFDTIRRIGRQIGMNVAEPYT